MKNRILSTVLAVMLVFSMLAVFSVSSSAEEVTGKITASIGNAYGEAGTTVTVPVYLAVENVSVEYNGVRDFQFKVALEQGATVTAITPYPTEGGTPYSFVNVGESRFASTANNGYFSASKVQVETVGGYKIADISVTIPAEATGTIAISGVAVEVMGLETEKAAARYDCASIATINPGTITIASTTSTETVEGAGEDYTIPTTNADGNVITSISGVSGTFNTIVIPATIDTIEKSFQNIEATNVVIKGTDYDTLPNGLNRYVMNMADNTVTVYLHKLPGQASTATWNAVVDTETEANIANILTAPSFSYSEDGTVTVIGIIAVNDTLYSDLTISVAFTEKTFTSKTTVVGKTINGITAPEGTYFCALQITGVPAEAVTGATAVVYGTTTDATGTNITVVSDTTVYGA